MHPLKPLLITPIAVLMMLPAATPATPAAPSAAASTEASARPDLERPRGRAVIVHNVGGRLENRGRVDPVAANLVQEVRKRQPYAAMLQEVCARQASAMDRRLEGYRVKFFPTGVSCPGNQGFGNAIVVRNGRVRTFQATLPDSRGGGRNIGCVTRKRTTFCSTHLTADRSRGHDRRRQAARVLQISRSYARRGNAVFVGGDFNDTPPAATLDYMYRPAYGGGARGIFTESDGCCGRDGPPTLGTAKFDYGFASGRWRVVRGWAGATASSDHNRVITILRRR